MATRRQTVKKREWGINALVRKGKKRFRIKENLRYYSPEDFKKAEKKFVKECILNGNCQL
jgi:hypothetical protein